VGALREKDKPPLLDEQQSLKDAQAMWGGTVGVLSSIGFVLNPLVVALPIAVGAISITVLRRKQNAVERVLADPPRFDYETSTRARRRRYVPEALGDDRLAVATDQAALATLRAAAYFEASVRADERSQGARIAGRADLMNWHLDEARHLFELGRRWSGEMAVALNVLAMSWGAFTVNSSLDEVPMPEEVPAGGLPSQAREALDRTGLVVGDIDLSIGRPEDARVALAPGRSTVGDLALDSAMTTRALAWAAGKVAAGERAFPPRTFEERALPSISRAYRLALQSKERGDLEEAQQHLLPAAERGSVDAMFELGSIAHAKGDRAQAREWLDRAAALSAPPPSIDYMKEVQRLPDDDQLPSSPKELDEPDKEER
jgi:TPR repeat protein